MTGTPVCLLGTGGRTGCQRLRAPATHGSGRRHRRHVQGRHRPRTVGGRSYTAQSVAANLGPHRFMFQGNLYYNQIGPFAGGGVTLAVFWPDFDAALPEDHPVRSVADGYRQVSIELRHVGGAGAADYLSQDLTGRVSLTPYAVDRSRVRAMYGR